LACRLKVYFPRPGLKIHWLQWGSL